MHLNVIENSFCAKNCVIVKVPDTPPSSVTAKGNLKITMKKWDLASSLGVWPPQLIQSDTLTVRKRGGGGAAEEKLAKGFLADEKKQRKVGL